MTRTDVLARLKAVEPALRARGVGSLYLYGSFGRDEGQDESDVDVFVEPDAGAFYDLSNFMGAYRDLCDAIPGRDIGFSTRDGLSKLIRASVEQDARKVF